MFKKDVKNSGNKALESQFRAARGAQDRSGYLGSHQKLVQDASKSPDPANIHVSMIFLQWSGVNLGQIWGTDGGLEILFCNPKTIFGKDGLLAQPICAILIVRTISTILIFLRQSKPRLLGN